MHFGFAEEAYDYREALIILFDFLALTYDICKLHCFHCTKACKSLLFRSF